MMSVVPLHVLVITIPIPITPATLMIIDVVIMLTHLMRRVILTGITTIGITIIIVVTT